MDNIRRGRHQSYLGSKKKGNVLDPLEQDDSLRYQAHPRSEVLFRENQQSSLQQMVTLFARHYKIVQAYFSTVQTQLTKLQAKISSLSGRFNQIEWKLTKGVYKLRQSHLLNEELVKINQQIQQKLNTLKNDYEALKRQKYISNIEKKIDQLKEVSHKLEIQHYRNKFSRQEWLIFEDGIEKLEEIVKKNKNWGNVQREIYHQVMRELIAVVKGEQKGVGQWVEEKILENIRLKFKLIKLSRPVDTNDQALQ